MGNPYFDNDERYQAYKRTQWDPYGPISPPRRERRTAPPPVSALAFKALTMVVSVMVVLALFGACGMVRP